MPPLKETYSQIQERNRREIRNRTNKRLAELAQKAESERHGSSSTQLADEIEDKIEDKIEHQIEDNIEDKTEDKIEDKLGLCASSLWRVCQCGVLGVFLVILSMFVWSVVFHLGFKKS